MGYYDERREDHDDEETEFQTPFAKIKTKGKDNSNFILLAVVVVFIGLVSWEMSVEHAKMTMALNDLYIAVMTPPEMKTNLPGPLKDRLEEKVREKTLRKLQSSE